MADETKNLALDLDPGARPGEKSLARIAVAEAWGFTRHGGGAVLTRDISPSPGRSARGARRTSSCSPRRR
jgi:hypothetical protein